MHLDSSSRDLLGVYHSEAGRSMDLVWECGRALSAAIRTLCLGTLKFLQVSAVSIRYERVWDRRCLCSAQLYLCVAG